MRVEHDLGEVDEPTDRGLDVAAAAALELVAFALRCSVGAAERAVVDLGPWGTMERKVTLSRFGPSEALRA